MVFADTSSVVLSVGAKFGSLEPGLQPRERGAAEVRPVRGSSGPFSLVLKPEEAGTLVSYNLTRGRLLEGDFRIGVWLVSPALNQISINGQSTRVEPKAMQVLVQLAQADGVINKDCLISAVWPDVFVSDDVLTGCIAALRRAFGDSARNPKVIETIPKSGYRLLLPVEWSNGNRSASAQTFVASPNKRRRFWLLAGAAACGTALLALLGWGFAFRPRYDSVAILPLVNAAGDPEVQYLSDGIAESVINDLSQAGSLRVMAWTTVSRYRPSQSDVQPDIQQLGNQLAVSAIFTGRLLRQADRLVVQTELVDARSGRQLWGKQYDTPLNDFLGLQEKLSRDIAANLRGRLTGADEKRIVSHYSASPAAYQLYLKGRFFWNQRNREALLKAIDYFQQAIKADPNYALAYSGLADSYNLLDDWGATPPRDSFPKARAAAEKAVALDDSLAEAHTSLAQVHESYEWNWTEAEREYKRAIELNPNYPTGHQWYAMFLATRHRFHEAEAEANRAYQLDPLAPPIAMTVAEVFDFERRYDQAIAQYKKVLEVNPSFAGAWGNLAYVYVEKGLYPDAFIAYRKESALAGEPERGIALERAYLNGGRNAFLRAELGYELQRRQIGKYSSAVGIAVHYAALGDSDQALQWIERAYEEHSSAIPFMTLHIEFDGIRNDPRFRYWIQTLALPE